MGSEGSICTYIQYEILIYFSYISHNRSRVKKFVNKLDLEHTGPDDEQYFSQVVDIVGPDAVA